MNRPHRVLYVTPYWPHRETCASELRALHIARALREWGEVDVVVVDAEGGRDEWAERSEKEFKVVHRVEVGPFPNRGWSGKLRWLLNPRVHYPHGCGVDAESMNQVLKIAQDFDIIWFCKLRTANMFPRLAWSRSVADIDDVPSMYEFSEWQGEPWSMRRVMAGARFLSWRRRDGRLGERFSVLGVCSDSDKRYLERLGVRTPMHVIPNGFPRPTATAVREVASPPRIGFIGIFDYPPNSDGMDWFARKCWPRVKQEVPEARLRLVGRQSDGPLAPAGPDIDRLGFLENPSAEMATWAAMVVPIFRGAGTRGKIAHAFSLKCPVISTTLGAHGYEAVDGREMLLADSPEGFADACVRAIRDPEATAAVAERASTRFLERWTWEAINPRIRAAAEECLRRGPR